MDIDALRAIALELFNSRAIHVIFGNQHQIVWVSYLFSQPPISHAFNLKEKIIK